MAAIMRRSSGLPSASDMRSATGKVESCQGKSSVDSSTCDAEPESEGSNAAAAANDAAFPPGLFAASIEPSTPAKNPFNQARCSGEKGADSGTMS